MSNIISEGYKKAFLPMINEAFYLLSEKEKTKWYEYFRCLVDGMEDYPYTPKQVFKAVMSYVAINSIGIHQIWEIEDETIIFDYISDFWSTFSDTKEALDSAHEYVESKSRDFNHFDLVFEKEEIRKEKEKFIYKAMISFKWSLNGHIKEVNSEIVGVYDESNEELIEKRTKTKFSFFNIFKGVENINERHTYYWIFHIYCWTFQY